MRDLLRNRADRFEAVPDAVRTLAEERAQEQDR